MSAYGRILVAVDGSRAADKGLREAIRVAKEGGAQLIVLHIVSEFYAYYAMEGAGLTGDVYERLREEGRRILDKARALAERQRLEPKSVMRQVAAGSAAEAIVREAKKQRADLIVLGTHGRRGMTRLVMGSDAEEVVRTAPVPVLLVRAGA
jgi:nucleotide-binding universal stress UspA family protein